MTLWGAESGREEKKSQTVGESEETSLFGLFAATSSISIEGKRD